MKARRPLLALFAVLVCGWGLAACSEPDGVELFVRRSAARDGVYVYRLPLTDTTAAYDFWFYSRPRKQALDDVQLNVQWLSPSGEGFSEEGNLVTRDLLYDEHTNKQFITVQTAGGNTFYIVIDYDKPVDEDGEQYETYFLSMTDEADLLAAAEAAGVEQAACSCSEKCVAGAVNTDCPVCAVNMTECAGVEPEPVETEETGEPAPEEAEPETGGNMGMLLLVLAVAVIGGGAGWYFKIYRPKHEKAAEPEEDYGGELDGYDGGEPYGDEGDDGPPWDEEDDDGEEAGK